MRPVLALALGAALAATATARPRHQVIFSPDGGFAPSNRNQKITLRDGSKVSPNLNVVADDMIQRVKKGGRIEVAMYAFSDMKALASMVNRARNGVAVRMVLDACASWTTDLRKMVFEELEKQKKYAKKDGDPFDFQVKTIPCEKFVEYNRYKDLAPGPGMPDGKRITGTMHEKFGVFFEPRRKMPTNSFAGSSNFAKSAATLYGENRTFFWKDPVASAQLHEQFQRLWKYWGECAFSGDQDDCETVRSIRNVEAGHRDIQMVFNGEPREGGDPKDPSKAKYRRIDRRIEKVLEQVKPKGSVWFSMFSFTHHRLKNKLLYLAKKNPKADFRVTLDLSMLAADNPDRPGVLGPLMEKEAEEMGLKNFQVRYKWRSNAHSYDPENDKVPPGLYHFKSHLLHHKLVIVNGDVVENGSYNWSSGAEYRNLENIQIFDRSRGHGPIVDQFVNEYEAIWNAKGPLDYDRDEFRPNPMVVPGPVGRRLQQRIVSALKKSGAREVTARFDKAWGKPLSVAEIAKDTGLSKTKVRRVCEDLREVTLFRRVGKDKYALAD